MLDNYWFSKRILPDNISAVCSLSAQSCSAIIFQQATAQPQQHFSRNWGKPDSCSSSFTGLIYWCFFSFPTSLKYTWKQVDEEEGCLTGRLSCCTRCGDTKRWERGLLAIIFKLWFAMTCVSVDHRCISLSQLAFSDRILSNFLCPLIVLFQFVSCHLQCKCQCVDIVAFFLFCVHYCYSVCYCPPSFCRLLAYTIYLYMISCSGNILPFPIQTHISLLLSSWSSSEHLLWPSVSFFHNTS